MNIIFIKLFFFKFYFLKKKKNRKYLLDYLIGLFIICRSCILLGFISTFIFLKGNFYGIFLRRDTLSREKCSTLAILARRFCYKKRAR